MASEDILIRLRLNGGRAVKADLVGVSAATRALGSDVTRSSIAMRGLGAATNGVRAAVNSAKIGLLALGATATAVGVKGVTAGLGFNAAFQSANTSFTTMLGSGRAARRFVEDLREVSAGTPLRLTEVFDAAKRMLGMEVSARRTARTLRALNAAVLATGGNSDTFNTAALALGQIQAKGKGSAEELMQLAEAGVPVQSILRKQLRLTADEVADIARSGISAERIIDAIARGWTQKYGSAAERARGDWTNQVAGMRKDWEQLQRVVSEPLFRRLNRDVFPVISRALRSGIRGMETGGMPGLFAGLDEGFGAGGRIVAVYRAIDSAIRDVSSTITEWFLPASEAAAGWLVALPKEAKLAFAGFAAAAALAFGGPLVWVGALVAGAVLVHKHWREISVFFTKLWGDIQDGVRNGVGAALRWLGDRFSLTGEDVKRTWQAIQNVARVAFAAIKVYAGVFLAWFKPLFEHVLLPAAKRTFGGIITAARGMARIVGGVIKIVTGVLTLDFGKAWQGVKQTFSGAAEYLVGIFQAITAPARSAIEGIWKGLAAGAKAAFDAVKGVVIGVINELIKAYQSTLGRVPGAPDIGLIDGGSGGDDVNPYGRRAGARLRGRYSRGARQFAGAIGLTPITAGAPTTQVLPLNVKVVTGDRALGEANGRYELKADRFR